MRRVPHTDEEIKQLLGEKIMLSRLSNSMFDTNFEFTGLGNSSSSLCELVAEGPMYLLVFFTDKRGDRGFKEQSRLYVLCKRSHIDAEDVIHATIVDGMQAKFYYRSTIRKMYHAFFP